jgi:hypothetical protein
MEKFMVMSLQLAIKINMGNEKINPERFKAINCKVFEVGYKKGKDFKSNSFD